MTTLADLSPNDKAIINDLSADADLSQRLQTMGMIPGEVVEYLRKAPLGDPLIFRIGGTRLSLRRAEADKVVVSLLEPALVS